MKDEDSFCVLYDQQFRHETLKKSSQGSCPANNPHNSSTRCDCKPRPVSHTWRQPEPSTPQQTLSQSCSSGKSATCFQLPSDLSSAGVHHTLRDSAVKPVSVKSVL